MWINISPLPLVKFGQLHPFQYTFGLSFYRVALFFFFFIPRKMTIGFVYL